MRGTEYGFASTETLGYCGINLGRAGLVDARLKVFNKALIRVDRNLTLALRIRAIKTVKVHKRLACEGRFSDHAARERADRPGQAGRLRSRP